MQEICRCWGVRYVVTSRLGKFGHHGALWRYEPRDALCCGFRASKNQVHCTLAVAAGACRGRGIAMPAFRQRNDGDDIAMANLWDKMVKNGHIKENYSQ